MNEDVIRNVDSSSQQLLSDLRQLISIPSVSDDPEQVDRALRHILDLGRQFGFRAYTAADGRVGVIEMGPGEEGEDIETLGILTHVDVVPPGDTSDWETPPFEMTIKGDAAYGRGTLDDKGMVLASVADTGRPQYKKTQLIIGTQEEVEWTDMYAYVRSCRLPDYGFTPDGEYPICNIEKGVIDISLEFDVTDPAPAKGVCVKSCNAGTVSNIVPGKAACLLSDGRNVEAFGRSVHSCQPEKGDNAIFHLTEKLESMELTENRLLQLIRKVSADLSDPLGRNVDLYSDGEYYEGEFVHRTILSPTILTSDGQTAQLNLNIRYAYGTQADEIKEKISQWAASLGGRITGVSDLPAVFVPKDKPCLKAFARAYEEVTGLTNEFTLAYGGSYAKAMPNIVSWGPIFPGDEDTCHEANENIRLDVLFQSAKIFAASIDEIVTTKESYK